MYGIINHLPWKLKMYILERFLKRKNVEFENLPRFEGRWPLIDNEGKMFIGANCSFRSFRLPLHFRVRENAELKIQNDTRFNDGVNLSAAQSITIGHHARIGDMVYIYDHNFHQVYPNVQPKVAPVIIGNNVWIGANSMILAGAVIGDHSVIAAGSIVTEGEIPAKSLVAGPSARVIKTLDVPDDWIRK